MCLLKTGPEGAVFLRMPCPGIPLDTVLSMDHRGLKETTSSKQTFEKWFCSGISWNPLYSQLWGPPFTVSVSLEGLPCVQALARALPFRCEEDGPMAQCRTPHAFLIIHLFLNSHPLHIFICVYKLYTFSTVLIYWVHYKIHAKIEI